MKPRTIVYFFKQAGKSLFRHGWMGAASILTTAIALLILGMFVIIMMNANLISGEIESNLEIIVWIEADASYEIIEDIGVYLQNLSQVTNVRHVCKHEGLEMINAAFGEGNDLLFTLGGVNPLQDFYVVKVYDPEFVRSTAQSVETIPYVESVAYGQDYLDAILSILYWVRMIGIGLTSLLAAAAVFLIGNTVRLTVYARSNEITIMKYIGATNWFVRWPFLIEGMFLGAIGAGIAATSIYFGYSVLVGYMAPTISFIPLIQDRELLLSIAGLLVATGTLMGGIASYLSLGRYLRF